VPNQCPNPGSVEDVRVGPVRTLAGAVVGSVERGDLRGALAAAKTLVAYVDAPVGDADGDDAGNDDGTRAGLAFVVSLAPIPTSLAMVLAA